MSAVCRGSEMEYQDFKYIMSDVSKIYIGAEMSYAEICAHDFAPFKLIAIIEQYLYKEASPDMTLKEHLLAMAKDSFSYQTLHHLKVSLKMNIYSQTTDRHGRTAQKWLIDQIVDVDSYVGEESYHQYPEHAIVTELIIKKLPLMMFSI